MVIVADVLESDPERRVDEDHRPYTVSSIGAGSKLAEPTRSMSGFVERVAEPQADKLLIERPSRCVPWPPARQASHPSLRRS
jgi:hypothetical protein